MFFADINLFGKIILALSITFLNSLMLPGQMYSFKADKEDSSKVGIFDPDSFISDKI